MKKFLLSLLSAILIFGFSSCEKEKITNDQKQPNLQIITDQDILSSLITPVNQPVEFKGANASELNYTWVYNISPGDLANGSGMSASTVDAYDKAVYAAWHTRGVDYGSYLVSLSIINPDNPNVLQAVYFEDFDINDIELKTNVDRLFVAGASLVDINGNSVGDRNAMAMGMDVNTGGSLDMNSSDFWMAHFYGASANSITYVANQTLWLSTGSRGGLTVFRDYDQEDIELSIDATNSKHFDATGDYGVLLSGTGFNESVLRVWDMSNLYAPETTYTIPYDVTPQGKNAVDINYNYAYLAMGNDGVVKVDLTNGEVVHRFDNDNGAFCNGVATDFRYVYAAYGADGLFVLDKETFELVGNWNFDGSCNYVKRVGDYLFLANGDTDGLIMLKRD